MFNIKGNTELGLGIRSGRPKTLLYLIRFQVNLNLTRFIPGLVTSGSGQVKVQIDRVTKKN